MDGRPQRFASSEALQAAGQGQAEKAQHLFQAAFYESVSVEFDITCLQKWTSFVLDRADDLDESNRPATVARVLISHHKFLDGIGNQLLQPGTNWDNESRDALLELHASVIDRCRAQANRHLDTAQRQYAESKGTGSWHEPWAWNDNEDLQMDATRSCNLAFEYVELLDELDARRLAILAQVLRSELSDKEYGQVIAEDRLTIGACGPGKNGKSEGGAV